MPINNNVVNLSDTNQGSFIENRRKIKEQFAQNNLKYALNEFYNQQKEFQQTMTNMVNAFSEIEKKLPEENKTLLSELLAPYRILATNLFHKPTGDIEKDVMHIIQVINNKNKKFKDALSAIADSAANLLTFHQFLAKCEQDKPLATEIKQQLNCKSWLSVQAAIDQPFQHLPKCELLLKTLKKSLIVESPASASDEVNVTIDYLVPQIKIINDNIDNFLFLDKIQKLLLKLLADLEIKKANCADDSANEIDQLAECITCVRECINAGKLNVIQGEQDIFSLFQGTLELLQGVEQRYTKFSAAQSKGAYPSPLSYAMATGTYLFSLPASFFHKTSDQQPIAEPIAALQDMIKELKDMVEIVDTLKNIQESKRI